MPTVFGCRGTEFWFAIPCLLSLDLDEGLDPDNTVVMANTNEQCYELLSSFSVVHTRTKYTTAV